jgi:hypothetical protein
MSTGLSVEMLPSQLTQIVESVFATMLSLEAGDPPGAVDDVVRDAVRIRGAEVRTRIAFRCAEGLFWITVPGMRS